MEIESGFKLDRNENRKDFSEFARSKTSLRINYEAQVEVIKNQTGELEDVRRALGLSARKMCQLLLVDPSTWTRWTKPGVTPPPHVWRSIQWFLALQSKVPGLTAGYFLNHAEAKKDPKLFEKIQNLEILVSKQQAKLQFFANLSVSGWVFAIALSIWILIIQLKF